MKIHVINKFLLTVSIIELLRVQLISTWSTRITLNDEVILRELSRVECIFNMFWLQLLWTMRVNILLRRNFQTFLNHFQIKSHTFGVQLNSVLYLDIKRRAAMIVWLNNLITGKVSHWSVQNSKNKDFCVLRKKDLTVYR